MVAFRVLAFIGIFSPLVVTAQTVKQCRPTPTCPRDNGCTATLSNGAKFEMKCSTDYDTSRIVAVTQANAFLDCGHACAEIAGCNAFNMKDNFCYHLANAGTARSGTNVIGALLKQSSTSPTTVGGPCGDTIDFDDTSDDGCTFVSNEKTFVGRDSTDFYGNDMAFMQTADLTACVKKCADTAGCMAVSWNGGSCYLKKTVGTGLYNVNVDGAYLLQ